MKILIISSRYHPNIVGGAERVAQKLAEAMVVRGHQTVVATLSPGRRHELAKVNGVRVHYLPLKNLYFSLARKKRPSAISRALWHGLDGYNPLMGASLGRVLEAERCDVVNTHNIAGFSVSAWRAVKSHRLPLVHTAHDFYILCPRSTMRRNGKNCVKPCSICLLYSASRRRLARLVDVATAPSQFVLDRYLQHGVFSNAVKMPIYNSCESPGRVDTPGKVRSGPLRLGFLGRLHPIKGVDLLVGSFLKLPAGRAELLVAGEGTVDYEQKLRRMTDSRTEVRWLGFVSSDELLRQVDVLVVPSLCQDSAPLVVLESMAHGVPLIGSCRGGIPELMGEGTGWIFDPEDEGALTRSMQLAIDSREELLVMGERARARSSWFSTESMVNGYLKAFSHAIENQQTQAR